MLSFIPYEKFIPCRFEDLKLEDDGKMRYTTWRKTCYAVYMMAVHGWSVWADLVGASHMSRLMGIQSLKYLVYHDLVGVEAYELYAWGNKRPNGQYRITFNVACLTEKGRQACRRIGWGPVDSEAERLVKYHEPAGEINRRHSAYVLNFAHHARLRGWQVTVLPDVSAWGMKQPDLMVFKTTPENPEQRYIVEVEQRFRNTRGTKWHQVAALARNMQANLAVVSYHARQRDRLVEELSGMGISGAAASLKELRGAVQEAEKIRKQSWIEARESGDEAPVIDFTTLPLFDVEF